MNEVQPLEHRYESRIRASVPRLFRWCGAWAATTALMAFGPKFLWSEVLGFTILAVVLNVVVGVGVILANKKFLDQLDELQRKVQLDAMGITLGVGLVAGVPFSVMAACHVIPFRADTSYLLIAMSLTLAIANLYGTWRYR